MLDNLELITPLMQFRSADDFFYLQILQRKKENDLMDSNSRVIKNYYITSVEQLVAYYPEIVSLCKKFNARASMRLNRRSFKQVALQTLGSVANTILNEDYKAIRKTYDRMCGQYNNDPDKKWILDIDRKELDVNRIFASVQFCMPNEGTEKHYCVIPSKSGYHVITKPFNVEQFKKTSRLDIEIHKDNPTNLYIP